MAQVKTLSGQDSSRSLMRFAMKAPMLEKEHELSLARRWRDDQDADALAELTHSYLRLVISVAGRFRNYGLPMSDLIQEGTVGLMEAAARFEPEREIRFSTYATWWIRSAMQDYILRNWSIVRTGTTAAHKTLFFNLRRVRAKIAGEYDKPMSLGSRQDVADHLGVRLRDVEVMEARLSSSDRSLNMMVGEEGDTQWQDFLPCEAPLPEEVVSYQRDSEVRSSLIKEAMGALTEREVIIISERQLTDESVTLSALGERLGISKERVRQIEAQALTKLKNALTRRVGDPVAAGLTEAGGAL
ncbi:MAG: RNA polymerase factor sigma-32 [Pseudomonadota bacterium]